MNPRSECGRRCHNALRTLATGQGDKAEGTNVIDPDLNGKTIQLSIEISIDTSITIDASGLPCGITIKANEGTSTLGDGDRIFKIEGTDSVPIEVTLVNLKLTGGDVGLTQAEINDKLNNNMPWTSDEVDGGAIWSRYASLTLEDSKVIDNAAPLEGHGRYVENLKIYEFLGGRGGGVYSEGNLTILNTIFKNNATDYYLTYGQAKWLDEPEQGKNAIQAGEVHSGDIYSVGNLTIRSSLFSTEDLVYPPGGALPNLFFGGIYATNDRDELGENDMGVQSFVAVEDTIFDSTAGMVVDTQTLRKLIDETQDPDLYAELTASPTIVTINNVVARQPLDTVGALAGVHLQYRDEWNTTGTSFVHHLKNVLIHDDDELDIFKYGAGYIVLNGVESEIDDLCMQIDNYAQEGVRIIESEARISNSTFLGRPGNQSNFTDVYILGEGDRSTVNTYWSIVDVENSVFAEMDTPYGVFQMGELSAATITDSTFFGNTSGSGIILWKRRFVDEYYDTHENGSVVHSDPDLGAFFGPSLYLPLGSGGDRIQGSLRIDGSVIKSNYLVDGGPQGNGAINVLLQDEDNETPWVLTIENTTVSHNVLEDPGSVDGDVPNVGNASPINLWGEVDAFITGSTISHNENYLNAGGGISASNRSLRVEDSTIAHNWTQYNGGGIYAFAALPHLDDEGDPILTGLTELELVNVTISDNLANWQGGGLFIDGGYWDQTSSERGTHEGDYVSNSREVATLLNTIVARNQALGNVPEDILEQPTGWRWPFYTEQEGIGISGDLTVPVAYHSDNTHDVWFSDPDSLSHDSKNNIFGIGVDPNLMPADTPTTVQSSALGNNTFGTFSNSVDPQLTLLGDFGGLTETYALRIGVTVHGLFSVYQQ